MKLRYERKYLVNNELLEPLRKRFMPFLIPDLNADQTDLKSESFIELDKLVELLQKNPTIKIEIAGHTVKKLKDLRIE